MPKQIAPFLMFTGAAEEAMTFYTSLFDNGRIVDVTRFGPGAPGAEGTVQLARFALAGQEFLCTDSPPVQPLGDYGFSRRFGWLNDRFGVSWQLNLA